MSLILNRDGTTIPHLFEVEPLATLALEVGTANRTSDVTTALDLVHEKGTVIIKVQVTDSTVVMIRTIDLVFAKEGFRVKDGEAGFERTFERLSRWIGSHD